MVRRSRPELFQRIRDEIETRRKRGELVLHVEDLHRTLSAQPPTEEEANSVQVVTEQLAAQGTIACSQVATGEPVLVLQVQEIERYAGSLIQLRGKIRAACPRSSCEPSASPISRCRESPRTSDRHAFRNGRF